MAGVYTDNQPDFAWLEVGEVKQFSQFWYPIKELGEPLNANARAAFNFSAESGLIKIYAVEDFKSAMVEILNNGLIVHSVKTDLPISRTTVIDAPCIRKLPDGALKVRVIDGNGKEIISFSRAELKPPVIPEPRKVDPSPYSLDNPDELYLAGLHVKQYRDALTKPDVYWRRAVEINPLHYQSLNGLGISAFKDFRLEVAEKHFRESIEILTRYNPNPRDGEAYYNLGLALKMQGRTDDAYDAFYKATWNYRWRSQGDYALATIDCIRKDYETAKKHLLESLDAYSGNQKARNLLAAVERKMGNLSGEIATETLRLDPLDYWALNEAGKDFFNMMSSDPSQTILDIVFEYTGASLFDDAADLLDRFTGKISKASPMVFYTLGWTLEHLGRSAEAAVAYRKARSACPDYCFPSRLEEMQILQHAVASCDDSRAAYYLGNLLYGKEHYEEAITQWEKALHGGENYYVLLRNLGMAYYNHHRNNSKSLKFMRKAFEINPEDPQLVFDLNHLLQLTNSPVNERISLLGNNPDMINRRDDLYLELVRVYNHIGNSVKAIELLNSHTFTPCEGGEHAILEQYIFAHFKLGRAALSEGRYQEALEYFRKGQVFPKNLGAGAWNIAIKIPSMYYEAQCLDNIDEEKALEIYHFIYDMGTDDFSYMYQPALDCYRAMVCEKLGKKDKAREMLGKLISGWEKKRKEKDYGYFQITPFFLSLMEKPADIRCQHYCYLLGLAYVAIGKKQMASKSFTKVLELNSGHLMAALEKSML
jgi:tetratricopeptide (TPR) repeat protein